MGKGRKGSSLECNMLERMGWEGEKGRKMRELNSEKDVIGIGKE